MGTLTVRLSPDMRTEQLRAAVRMCAASHAFPPLWIAGSGKRSCFQLPATAGAFIPASLSWDEATLFDIWWEFRRIYHAGEVA